MSRTVSPERMRELREFVSRGAVSAAVAEAKEFCEGLVALFETPDERAARRLHDETCERRRQLAALLSLLNGNRNAMAPYSYAVASKLIEEFWVDDAVSRLGNIGGQR